MSALLFVPSRRKVLVTFACSENTVLAIFNILDRSFETVDRWTRVADRPWYFKPISIQIIDPFDWSETQSNFSQNSPQNSPKFPKTFQFFLKFFKILPIVLGWSRLTIRSSAGQSKGNTHSLTSMNFFRQWAKFVFLSWKKCTFGSTIRLWKISQSRSDRQSGLRLATLRWILLDPVGYKLYHLTNCL